MVLLLKIGLSFLLALSLAAPLALADADGPDFYAVTGVAPGDVLNLRAGPSGNAERIGVIPHDARGLQNLGCQGQPSFAEWQAMSPEERVRRGKRVWCRVRYQGVEGWVAGRYLREASGRPVP